MTSLPIVELRRYRLHPGQRDTLIDLFENEFLESQDDVGAHVLGQFRVDGAPDQFVWLRGFEAFDDRRTALDAFYGGPVWRAHRDRANATMADSDDVHLLSTMAPQDGFVRPARPRRPRGAFATNGSRFIVMLYRLADNGRAAEFDARLRAALAETGIDPLASFFTLAAENNYPRLPIHTDDPVHVVLLRFDNAVGLETWLQAPPAGLSDFLKAPPETLILQPTARSLLR
ncbi:NIPSNAP family containing protein [Youhaiella tibetensis]|uniref:NIPSNAP family protein n=1 Tax=Paradevosia tibetensis TaxID=1447062 RepID=UPI00147869A6|nr:NIPSNAP family protein [Youhaiella tibetensis]GGF38858.1 NIPSNAP family containing protein [Youhaiella tibetensis]